MLIVIVIILIWLIRKRLPKKIIWTIFLLLMLPQVVLMGGWQFRNYRLTGNIEFSSIGGINMLFYRASAVIALRDNISIAEAREKLTGNSKNKLIQEAILHPENHMSKKWNDQASKIIKQYPMLYCKVLIKGIQNMFIGPGDGTLAGLLGINTPGDKKHGPLGDIFRLSISEYINRWIIDSPVGFLFFAWGIAYLIILYGGIAIFIYQIISERALNINDVFLLSVMLYFIIISAGPEAYYRFRVPITPILALYSAKGLGQLIFKNNCRLQKSRQNRI
jgi:hypothetical protein